MFKYTPPWQVLCNSLDHGSKRQSTFASGSSQDVHKPRKGQTLSHLYPPAAAPVSVHVEDCLPSRNTMGSTPKRWVLKPLTPKLEKSDLRAMMSPGSEAQSPDYPWSGGRDGDSPTFSFDSISVTRLHSSVTVSVPNGEGAKDVVVLARQVAVSEEGSTTDDGQPSDFSSPGTPSSTDSRVGFYSFVEDPTSPEAEKNEAYMVSPERQAKLSTLQQKSSFKLQTYVEERRPEKLFEESNGESSYKVESASTMDSDEEKPDRIDIIRSQAPKKNPVFKEQWSSLENLDLSKNPYSLVEGFSLCYSPVSTKSPQIEVGPGTIDNQQIDFNAARQQFLLMERSKDNPFRYSPEQLPQFSKPWERSLSEADLFTKDVSKKIVSQNSKDESSQKRQDEETKTTVTVFEDPDDRTQNTLIDDLDSLPKRFGDQNKGWTNDESLSSISEMDISSTVACLIETPIDREIRIAKEREEELRRSRGIFCDDTSEMVEIKMKPILSQPSPELKPIKAKESNRVSFLIQREIDRANRSSGTYEKKTPTSDLVEKRKAVASQSYKEPISPVTVEDSWTAERPALVEPRDVPDSQETLAPCCPHRHKDETQIQRGPTAGFQDRTFRTTKTENWDVRVANQPAWMTTYTVKESERTISPINSPSSPLEPVKSGSRSIAARRSYWEGSAEWPRLQNVSDIIRKEIEEDLRREQELQELRELGNLSLTTDNRGISETTTSETIHEQSDAEQTSLNSSQENLVEVDEVLPERSTEMPTYNLSYSWSGDSTPTRISLAAGSTTRLPSMFVVTAQPWSSPKPASPAVPRAVPTFLSSSRPEAFSTSSQKGLTETLLEDFEERRAKLKLEESSYAGIQPIDSINNEVVEATRVTRHKNNRALRWEAGVYDNEDN
ncbi:mitotic interactor and substrate of PLK1 isoform X1 [Astyanax mexicanus]|uniref:mitotic interactor and substrate of PLK1 isoform X1 n=2 Tax=Astyanax mexicanus TaxID=7994 RepID=UPI0020CB3424|nr:mitotic interactor and substrate of PLK1 isoform X1 [Astyanax mexicanus]